MSHNFQPKLVGLPQKLEFMDENCIFAPVCPSQNTPRQESFLSFLDALLGHDHNCPSHGEKCLLPSYAIQPVSSTQGGRGYA